MTDTSLIRPEIVLIAAVAETNRVGEPGCLGGSPRPEDFREIFCEIKGCGGA